MGSNRKTEKQLSSRRKAPTRHQRLSGRAKEARLIETADKAAAIGRLLLGKIDREFFEVAERNYETLPRRCLKSGKRDVRENVSREIKSFYRKNFEGMSESKLADLYDITVDLVKRGEALALPLPEFEQRFFRIRREVLRHAPRYCTVVISRRGLQTMFPEDLLAKDIMAAMEILSDVA